MNRLKDEVYREMLRLEGRRPGAEMGLALAILRARVASDTLPETRQDRDWLKTICPICLRMIEESLDRYGVVARMLQNVCESKSVQ